MVCSLNVASYVPPVAVAATSSGRSFTTAFVFRTAHSAGITSRSMLPPYCCWLVGVCAEPGKDGPPNVPGGVAWDRPRLRWRRRAQGSRRRRKPHAVNHNVRKLRIAQYLPEPVLAPSVLRFAHYNNRASPVGCAVTQHSHGGGKRVIQARAAVAGLQRGDGFFDFVVVRAEGQQVGDAVVIADHRAFAGRADDGLREDDCRFLDGRQKRRDARAGFKHQYGRERLAPEIERFDRLVDIVVEDVKTFLIQIEYRLAFRVDHHHGCAHELHPHADRAFGSLLHRRAGLRGNRPLGLWRGAGARRPALVRLRPRRKW